MQQVEAAFSSDSFKSGNFYGQFLLFRESYFLPEFIVFVQIFAQVFF